MPSLYGPSSGANIGELVLAELKALGVPFQNCVSLSSDNAPVMLGSKGGVIAKLRESQPDLFAIGCPCHLINLAAQHAASELPLSIDSLLIDVYYYLEASVNRKQNFQEFQDLMGVDQQRILKHVCTRWLSLGQCLPRFNLQWGALQKFFEAESGENKTNGQKDMTPLLKSFMIPKKNGPISSSAAPSSSKSTDTDDRAICKNKEDKNHHLNQERKTKGHHKPTSGSLAPMKIKKKDASSSTKRKLAPSQSAPPTKKKCQKPEVNIGGKPDMQTEPVKSTRPQKISQSLNSKMTRAISCFLQFSITNFEKTNVILQTNQPLIQPLNKQKSNT